MNSIDPQHLCTDVNHACRWLGLDADAVDAIGLAAGRLVDSPQWLTRLDQAVAAITNPAIPAKRDNFPMHPPAGTVEADLFYAVALLAAIDHPRAIHAGLGIDPAVTRDTCRDLQRWLDDFRTAHGRWGLVEQHWLAKFWRGEIFELGRLQFEKSTFLGCASLWADPANPAGPPLMLAREGLGLDADGTPLPDDQPAAITCRFVRDGATVTAHRLGPDGLASTAPESFPLGQAEPLLTDGDAVLSVHIPAGAPLAEAACADAYARALRFFADHLPQFPWRAMVCHSWLCDPQLARHLPASSNIVRFQRAYHPLANPAGEHEQIWHRVFGEVPADLDEAPRKTSLQRMIIDQARAGVQWRLVTGVMLRREAEQRFGSNA